MSKQAAPRSTFQVLTTLSNWPRSERSFRLSDVLMYLREHPNSTSFLIALNLGDQPAAALVREIPLLGEVALSTFCDRDGEPIDRDIDLRPNEGVVIKLQ
jgi:hypothetical protein